MRSRRFTGCTRRRSRREHGVVGAVRVHDVHHVVTGDGTAWIGEAEIGAWEIGSRCGDY